MTPMRDLEEDILEAALEDYGIEDVEIWLADGAIHLEVLCSTHDMKRDADIRDLAKRHGLKLSLVPAGQLYDEVWEAG